MMRWSTGSFLLTVLALLAWLAVYLRGDAFPEKVPVHWNVDMQPDGWVSGEGAIWWLLFLPGAMAVMLSLNCLLPLFSPATFRESSMRAKLDLAFFLSVAFFGVLSVLLYIGMKTGELPVRAFLGAFFVFFGLLGSTMRGLKQNGWIGVRTPWTLRSEAVWNRTHELTATLWMATGAIGLVAVIAGAPPIYCVFGFVPAGLLPIAASYWYSRTR